MAGLRSNDSDTRLLLCCRLGRHVRFLIEVRGIVRILGYTVHGVVRIHVVICRGLVLVVLVLGYIIEGTKCSRSASTVLLERHGTTDDESVNAGREVEGVQGEL